MRDMQHVDEHGADEHHPEGVEKINLQRILAANEEQVLRLSANEIPLLYPIFQITSKDEYHNRHRHHAEQIEDA